MFGMSDKKRLQKERKERRKNIGLGLVALGTAGLAFSLLRREKKVDRLSLDIVKKVLVSPKADSMYVVHALVKVPDPPMYIGSFFMFPIGGGPDYDSRRGEMTILQTGKTFSTKYKPILFQTDNPKYVTWKDDFPLNKVSEELEQKFAGHRRFEVKKNIDPVYFCPKNLLASDTPHVLARAIANAEVEYDKIALMGYTSALGAGLLLATF
ncbi:transmembrane domain-containing protein [Marseillevirus Shanghai 1]|uniref:hypothetical protein n=1 Tax=Melbournevirus TaxID=1560514 RepID=UPI00051F59D4|nr:hypothetical protein MEL_030 [Melbournevirus]AIT54643.1 transmembrane domain-containing protein [Melbournevirus]AVR52737.1 transmembrane domain-containing protein [Marseillevirus Shanghai 1]